MATATRFRLSTWNDRPTSGFHKRSRILQYGIVMVPREILFGSFMLILFVRSGSTPPLWRFGSTCAQSPRYCNGEGEHLSMSVIGGVWDGCFLGAQATPPWVIMDHFGMSTGKPTTLGHVLKVKGISRCRNGQYRQTPVKYHSIQRCSKHLIYRARGSNLGTWKHSQTWDDFRPWKLTSMTWAMTGPISHPVSDAPCHKDWRACFPWASWLFASGLLGWRIWGETENSC